MVRYAVRYQSITDGSVWYVCVGKGATQEAQEAHLYTSLDLATKKAAHYIKHKQWYADVKIIPVQVLWQE